MNRLLTFKHLTGLTAAAALAITAVVVTQATGDTTQPMSAPATPREAAYLAATQAELAATKYGVTSIHLETRVDGREVYSLRGINTWCILTAGAGQEAGHSQELGCVDSTVAVADLPMQTGFDLQSGCGHVDLIWASGGAPSSSAVTVSGAPADVSVGSDVITVIRSDDSEGSHISWMAPSGTPVNVDLPSRAERAARLRAAID